MKYLNDSSEGLPIEIIENTYEAGKERESLYGSRSIKLTDEQIDALKEGKLLTFNDDEYSTFIGHRQ